MEALEYSTSLANIKLLIYFSKLLPVLVFHFSGTNKLCILSSNGELLDTYFQECSDFCFNQYGFRQHICQCTAHSLSGYRDPPPWTLASTWRLRRPHGTQLQSKK